MHKTCFRLLTPGLIAASLLATTHAYAEQPVLPQFAVSEHVTLGNEVALSLSPSEPKKAGLQLTAPNGLSFSYGQILSFGDFYGTPGEPISKGLTEDDRANRFITAFSMFALSNKAQTEVSKLLSIEEQEEVIVNTRMKNGEAPEDIFKSISNEMGRQFNCATGGGCDSSTWWLHPGRYLKLAQDNYDHFGDDALLAYETGHKLALDEAKLARKQHDTTKLELAYALNAFASHYLSDRFSAGHIRTPRHELPKSVTPELVGALLAGYMHNEESAAGIHVTNQHGDRWIAYGDWSYFNSNNATSRDLIKATLQASADEVFFAYQYGESNPASSVAAYIPYADETDNNANIDISPMFYWDKTTDKVMRRSNLSNLYDRHWTDQWWGWSTLAELKEERGNRIKN